MSQDRAHPEDSASCTNKLQQGLRLGCEGARGSIRQQLTVIPSVMNRTRAAVMWMVKKVQGAPWKFFLWQQLKRSSCPGEVWEGRGESPSAPLLLPSQGGGCWLAMSFTFCSFQLPIKSSLCLPWWGRQPWWNQSDQVTCLKPHRQG